MDRQRRHREDEASDERRSLAPRPTAAAGADAAILDLQATAGNRAVTELLGPAAGDVAIQRDATDGTPTAEPADAGASTTSTMAVPALKLSMPLLSVRQGPATSPGSASGVGTAKPEQSTAGEVAVTFKADNLDPRLWKAAADGRTFDVVTISMASVTLTLHGVTISSVQTGGDTNSLTLNFESREFTSGAGGG